MVRSRMVIGLGDFSYKHRVSDMDLYLAIPSRSWWRLVSALETHDHLPIANLCMCIVVGLQSCGVRNIRFIGVAHEKACGVAIPHGLSYSTYAVIGES